MRADAQVVLHEVDEAYVEAQRYGVNLADSNQGKTGTNGELETEAPINVPAQILPLTDTTNESATDKAVDGEAKKNGAPRKQRGPPEDGVPSKTKIMVANLPYDLSEEKVRKCSSGTI